MRKFFAIVLSLTLMLSLASLPAAAEGFSGEVKIWVPDAMVDLTLAKVEEFKAAHPEYAG
ncbi:MAG: hypothetical protein GX540_02195, partial [Clostridiales bacterium]|nr:hypothetical protein [Clostridiales bacterium]